MEYLSSLNWTAVAAASLASFVFGNVWFHPGVFGLTWAQAAGVELRMTALAFVGTLAATILGCVGLAWIMRWLGVSGLSAGVGVGLLMLAVFVLPAILGQWLFMDRIRLFAVNAGFNLVNLMLTGAIIGLLQK